MEFNLIVIVMKFPAGCWEFHYDDISVTLFVSIKYGNIAVESVLNEQHTVICYSPSANFLYQTVHWSI